MSDPLRTPAQMQWILRRFKPDGLERLARSTPDYYEQKGYYLPDVAALAHAAIAAGDALRMAVGEAILVTTADEVRMPRADWDCIVEAAIAQRRTTDPTAVDDGERYPREENE